MCADHRTFSSICSVMSCPPAAAIVAPTAISTSGPSRKRKWLGGPTAISFPEKQCCGGGLSVTSTSVVVTARCYPSDVKWHVLPTRIEIQPQGRERLDFRVGRDASLVAVAAELAADDARRGWWTDRQYLTFSSRRASSSGPTGGSIASRATIWRMWFWMMSRIAPTSS